ncbi:MAG: SulP family inorganic anion transporter [Burkholderiales bacterium]|nr:SulP family inorganic anion transporter [Burkholderiales bacterium]
MRWWPKVNRGTLRADALAGLTGAVVVLPQGVAFAAIAGLPPEYGLYAAMIPAVIAALWGSSWHLVSGPTTAISIVVYSTVSGLAVPGSPEYIRLVLAMTLLVGVFQLAMGLARLGALVNFISHTVVVGFTAGAGLLIISTQIRHFFGIDMPGGISFAETVQHTLAGLGDIDWIATAIGMVTLLSGLLVKRRFPRLPYMIIALLAGSLVAAALKFIPGIDAASHIRMVQALSGLVPAFSPPEITLETLRKTLPIALAVAMLGLTEAVSIARAIANRSEQRIDGNQEFIGQGLSNIAGSFFSAYASSGSFNRSGVNYDAGARTPLAAVLSALFLLLIVLLVAPLLQFLPVPAMAGLLFMVAWGLIDIRQMRGILRASRAEAVVLLVTLLATLFVELEFAIYAGILLSLMLYLNRTSHPVIRDVKPDPAEDSYHYSADTGLPDCPQLKCLRINGSLFFGAVDHVQQALMEIGERTPQKHVLVVASGINFVDVAGAELLVQEARRRRRMGGGLYFYRLKDEVVQLLERGGYLDEIGRERTFPVKSRALAAIYPKLDAAQCRDCTLRIFRECRSHLPDGTPRQMPT